MCELSQHSHPFRRRSSSISLTVFQWTGSNNQDSGIGSSGSLNSFGAGMITSGRSGDGSDTLSRAESHAISSAIDIRRVSDSDVVDFRFRSYAFGGRSISGSSLESVSRSIGTQTPTEDGTFEFPEPGQAFQRMRHESGSGVAEDVADESTPLIPFNADLSNARLRNSRLRQIGGRPKISRSNSDSGCLGSRMTRAESSEPNLLQSSPFIRGILSRRRNLPDLLTALPQSPSSSRSNVPRTNAIPIPGPSSSGASSSTRRHSISYAVRDTESVGQQLRSIGDDLDRASNSTGTSANNRFFGRSRSLSMLPRSTQGQRRNSTSSSSMF